MEPIHVLGYDRVHVPSILENCQGAMSAARPGVTYSRPPEEGAAPVASAERLVAGEFLVRNRFAAHPLARRVSVGRYAAARGDAGAAQYKEWAAVAQHSGRFKTAD